MVCSSSGIEFSGSINRWEVLLNSWAVEILSKKTLSEEAIIFVLAVSEKRTFTTVASPDVGLLGNNIHRTVETPHFLVQDFLLVPADKLSVSAQQSYLTEH